jgi:hypothetical protein
MQHEYCALVLRLREALTQQRYNPVVVHNYCRNADHFLSYLEERRIALEGVTPTEVSNYLRLAVRQFRKRHGRAPVPSLACGLRMQLTSRAAMREAGVGQSRPKNVG